MNALKRISSRIGVLPIAVCALLAAGVATSASGQGATTATLNLTELEKGSTFTHIRNTRTRASNANSQGDLIVFTNPLADASGKRIGKLSVSCTTTTGARDFRRSTVTCAGVLTLPGGTLTVQANVRPEDGSTTTGAITGGSGAFAAARGEFSSRNGRRGNQDTITYTTE